MHRVVSDERDEDGGGLIKVVSEHIQLEEGGGKTYAFLVVGSLHSAQMLKVATRYP